MIPYIIEAELVVTDSLCMITGNALAHEYRNASHAESRVVEKMMSVLHDELQKPLIDGGWKIIRGYGGSQSSGSQGSGSRDTLPESSVPGSPGLTRLRQVDRQLNFGGNPFVNIVVHVTASLPSTAGILDKINWQKIEGALKA
jgi:hypothetical protein